MKYEFKHRTGVRGVINISDAQITGDRDKFIAKHVVWWAKAKGVPEAKMAEMLGEMWDKANPAKPAKAEKKAE